MNIYRTCLLCLILLAGAPAASCAENVPFLTLWCRSNDLQLRWTSQLAENFLLQHRANILPATVWQTLASNLPAASDGGTVFTHTNAGASPSGFYRVARLGFAFDWTGTNFTYSDAVRSFTGIMLKPAGNGPFPAVIISHGAGGTANGYSLSKAREMSPWGIVCIAPTLTHVANGETNSWNMGNCPENIARIAVCANVLATLPYVDTNRLALFGHSMGAFATIGSAAALTTRLRTAVITAGGVILDSAGTNNAAPTVTEASPNRIPFLMFHCDADPVVPSVRSELLQQILTTNSVLTQRVLYSSNSIPNSNNWHNLHQDPIINADVISRVFLWLQAREILP